MNTETWLKKRIKQCEAELKYWESREGNLAENQAHLWRGEVRYYKTAQHHMHADTALDTAKPGDATPKTESTKPAGSQAAPVM